MKNRVRLTCPDCPDATLLLKEVVLTDADRILVIGGCPECGRTLGTDLEKLLVGLYAGGNREKGN